MRSLIYAILSLIVFASECSGEGTTPDQVHLSFTGDMTEMAVVWNTFADASQDVSYGKKGSGSSSIAKGSSEAWVYGGITRYRHKATMTGLDYSNEYEYTISSRTFSFKTLSKDPQSYRVCVFGDLGYWHGNSTESIIKHGLAGDFDFIVHLGDIAYDLHTDNGNVGDSYLNVFEPLISKMPYMVIAGNHEDDYQNFTNYQKRFAVPDNGHNDNQFYSFNLGPVHWVGVSTENYGYYYSYGMDPVFTQYEWLKNDLTNANANRAAQPWIFTFQHRPFYCSNVNSAECQSFENRLVMSIFECFSINFHFRFALVGWTCPDWNPSFYKHQLTLDSGVTSILTKDFIQLPIDNIGMILTHMLNPKAPRCILSVDPLDVILQTPGSVINHGPWSAARNNDYGWSIVTIANRTHVRVEQISIDKNEATVDDFWVIKDEGYTHSGDM
ncbi:hypothetical protein CAEBREN_31844, partial [Caenorhabditis brenneri]